MTIIFGRDGFEESDEPVTYIAPQVDNLRHFEAIGWYWGGPRYPWWQIPFRWVLRKPLYRGGDRVINPGRTADHCDECEDL